MTMTDRTEDAEREGERRGPPPSPAIPESAAAVTDKAQVEGWLVGQEGTRLELPPIDGNHPPANQRPTELPL